MVTFFYLRPVAAALIVVLFTAGASAADAAKGSTSDKDKKGSDSHGSVERTVTRDSSGSSSPERSAAPARDSSPSRATPALGGASPSAKAPASSASAMQPRFSGPSPVFNDNWRDRSDRDREDRERDDRQRREREDDRRAIYAGPNAAGFANATGTLVGVGNGVLRVAANGQTWQVRPDVGATTELTGTAGPDFLKPGLIVKFQAAFDPNGKDKDKATAPLTALEIISSRPGETIGAVPAATDAKQQNAAQPAAPSFVVIGNVKSYRQKELVVSAGAHIFKADLDSLPQIKVRMSDFRFARAGDQVQLTGYAVRPGLIVASQIIVTMAAPLGDPLAEYGKVKLATGQK
jgi:hypothetical protein